MAWAMVAGLFAAPIAAHAQQTSQNATIIGELSNFDAINDTENEKEGFEIQIEGIESRDITRVFGQTGATCYIRYCIGSVTDVPAGIDPVTGLSRPAYVSVKWAANYDAATHQFTTPLNAPGGGSSGTPSRVGANAPLVNGDQCWSLGLGGAYPTSGCEHFGISTAAGKNPTKTTYQWLVGDPATGVIAPAVVNVAPPGAPPVNVYAPPVPIPHPVAVVDALGQVQAAIQAPPPVPAAPDAVAHRYGKAQWVKVYKTELGRNADLDELVGGHPNHVIEIAENAGAETEWKLLQFDVSNPTKGSSQLVNHGSNSGSRSVVRRYEFYKYTGPVVAPGGTSGRGGTKLSTDDQEQSACLRDANGECVGPGPGELGDYIGAQMAAQNLGDPVVLIDQTITLTLPAALTYGDADFTVTGTGGGSGNPVLFAASGSCASTATPGVLTIVGAGTCSVTATQDGNASYAPAAPVTQSVDVALATATVTFDAGTLSQIYSGILKTVSTTTVPGGLGVVLSFTGMPQDAGSYPVTATINDPNYAGSATDTLVINKTDATFSISGYDGVYDGLAHGATGSATGVQGESLNALLHLGASFTNVPGGAADWTFDGDTNYNPSNGSAAITISKATATVALSDLTQTYTGAALSPTVTTTPPVGFSLTGAPQIAAGSYAVTATVTDPNYDGSASGTFTIGKATATVVLSNLTQNSTGGPLSPTVTVTPAVGFTLIGAPQTAAGSYPVTATVTDPNYQGSASGTFTIVAAPPPVAFSIAPIADQFNTDGDEVELQVVVVGGAGSAIRVSSIRMSSASGSVEGDDDARKGLFAARGLPNGLKIDREDGDIDGHIRTNVTVVTTFDVTVTFTRNGVTASQTFKWTVKPAASKRGGKG